MPTVSIVLKIGFLIEPAEPSSHGSTGLIGGSTGYFSKPPF